MSTDEGLLRKAALRRRLTAQRKALHPDQVDARGLKVQSRFLATPDYQRARTVALYAPFGGEVPTRDILTAAEPCVQRPLNPVEPGGNRGGAP